MPLFRKKFHSSSVGDIPKPAPFYDTVPQTEELPVYNKNGKQVSTIVNNTFLKVPVPIEKLRNDGLTCDMFSIENLEKSGVMQTLVTQSQFSDDIHHVGEITDVIEGIDFSEYVEDSNNEPSKTE